MKTFELLKVLIDNQASLDNSEVIEITSAKDLYYNATKYFEGSNDMLLNSKKKFKNDILPYENGSIFVYTCSNYQARMITYDLDKQNARYYIFPINWKTDIIFIPIE